MKKTQMDLAPLSSSPAGRFPVPEREGNAHRKLPPRRRTLSTVIPAFAAGAMLLGMSAAGHAANWYVRPSAAGSGSGSDWNNAWSLSGVSWSKVQPGDTVWLAGGSYPSLTPGKSGTAGNLIAIKRASANDSGATTAAGWNSAFDALVTLSGGSDFTGRSYVVLDGNKPNGIRVTVPNGGSGITLESTSGTVSNSVQLKNLEFKGPGFRVTTSETNGIRSYLGYEKLNLLISHCRFDGMDVMIHANAWNTCTIEQTTFINCSSGNLSAVHPDTIYFAPCKNVTVRNCRFENVDVESIFFDYGGSTQMYFYGNVMVQGTGIACTAIELKQGYTWGTFFIYNNVFVGWEKGVTFRAPVASGSVTKNNIFWNCANNTAGAVSDYNGYYGVSAVGTHALTNSVDPFVSKSTGDYRLKASSWPVNAGTNLGTTFNTDADGGIRGSDGAWDLGAYEYGSAVSGAPNAPRNLRIQAAP